MKNQIKTDRLADKFFDTIYGGMQIFFFQLHLLPPYSLHCHEIKTTKDFDYKFVRLIDIFKRSKRGVADAYLIPRAASNSLSNPVNSSCMIPHLSLSKSINEKEEKCQRKDSSHAAGNKSEADVCSTVLRLAIVTYEKNVLTLNQHFSGDIQKQDNTLTRDESYFL